MISVQQAFSILQANLPTLPEVEISLFQARKHILTQSLFSPINMPPFRQSAMDGYALCLHNALEYEIVGEVKAGDSHTVELFPGQAVKIFTGAARNKCQTNWRANFGRRISTRKRNDFECCVDWIFGWTWIYKS
jgi:molybdopterin biosynthesis enzyme